MKRCVDIDEFKESLIHCKELGEKELEVVSKVLKEQYVIEIDEDLVSKSKLIKNLHEGLDGSGYDEDYKEMGIDDYILNQPTIYSKHERVERGQIVWENKRQKSKYKTRE